MDAVQELGRIRNEMIYWLVEKTMYVRSELEKLSDQELYKIFDEEYTF